MQMADELRGVISLQNNVTPVLREIIKGLKEMGADSKSAQKAMESLEDLNLSGAQNETRKAASEVENVGKEAENPLLLENVADWKAAPVDLERM